MTKTIAITIPDLDIRLHTAAKAAAAVARISLKEWFKEAFREKLDKEKN